MSETDSSPLDAESAVSIPPDNVGRDKNAEFAYRVQAVAEAIKDEAKSRQAIAEIHTWLSMFDETFTGMMGMMQQSGGSPMGMLKMMMGKKG